MAHRCVPAPFLTKTYQLVEDPISDDIISWNEKGTTFVVWKSAEFARDLLPNYFKHNNFSSFVRQLNTYGFRKIVPDRWEFANDFFKRGEKELLCEIHRRKAVHSSSTVQVAVGGKSNGSSSPSNSGDDLGSTSSSSPETKNNGSDDTTTTQLSNLSGLNEKLRKDNEILSLELARTKKQCEDLVAFLSQYVNVAPDEINRVMTMQEQQISGRERLVESDEKDEKKSLKLFGVWLKGSKDDNVKKRGREDDDDRSGLSMKEMRMSGSIAASAAVGYEAPWMKIMSGATGETSKVCN